MEFRYTARTKRGQTQKGTIESSSKREAISTLQDRGLIILDIVDITVTSLFDQPITFFRRVKEKEKVAFARQLSTLFSAKVSLLESLRALARQSENKYFGEVIFDIASEVEGGSLFSKALAKYPKVFSAFFVNLIRSGEVSGGLDRALNYLADYLEKQHYLNSKIRGAMVYPAFISVAFIVIAILMMVLVIPQLTGFLLETGVELPLPTKILIAASEFMRGWGGRITGLALIIILAAFIMFVNRSMTARYYWDSLKLKMPIFSTIFRGIYLARITDNLSTLIKGGLPILQALQVAADVVGNAIYRRILMEAKESVRVGNTISSCFEKYKEIPPVVTQMVATGEKTGSLDEILKKLSDFYTKEVDAMVGSLSQLIEPILIIVLGIGVAILVSAILVPIYSVTSAM